MDVLNFSNDAKSLSSRYVDSDNINIKSTRFNLEQGIDIFTSEAFNDINDCKINNYSALFLTDKKLGEDILEFSSIDSDHIEVIITSIATDDFNIYPDDARFLHIDDVSDVDNELITSYTFRLSGEVEDFNRTIFEIELLDYKYCRIFHRDENNAYYLTINDDLEFFFKNHTNKFLPQYSLSAIEDNVFGYILDKDAEAITFFKQLSSTNGTGYRVLTISEGTNGTRLSLIPAPSGLGGLYSGHKHFNINYNKQSIVPKLNTSWVSYDITDDYNQLKVNSDKSTFNNQSNYLLTTQYSNATGNELIFNVLTLKNQLTEDNSQLRGNYLESSSNDNYPTVQMREYERFHTGSRQERGDDVITLMYTFYNADYVFEPDKYTTFNTPANMYPYTRININDTLFAKNGSLGGDSPHTSDKIFVQKNTATEPKDGMYLCTWLSGGDYSSPGIWVDRYYNPKKVNFFEAMTASVVKLYDYVDPIECLIRSNVSLENHFDSYDYIDKLSELSLEPSRSYVYHRIGNTYVSDFLEHLNDNELIRELPNVKTAQGGILAVRNTSPDEKTYNFTNIYSVIDNYDMINDNSEFTLSFWLESDDWSAPFGHQIIGNLTDQGIGVINDRKITPFVTIQSGSAVYIYNTGWEKRDTILFNDVVVDIIRTDHLDAFYVTTETNKLFKVQSNGPIFDKIAISTLDNYTSYYNTANAIYFLMDTIGTVKKLDLLTEEITSAGIATTAEEPGISPDVKSIIVESDGTIRGFRGQKAIEYGEDDTIYLVNNAVLVLENNDHTTRSIMLTSTSMIKDFAIDQDKNIYVLHNEKLVTKLTPERIPIYKSTISTSELSSISIDIVREYTASGLKQYPIVISHDSRNRIHITKIDDSTSEATTKLITGANGSYIPYCGEGTNLKYNLTNFKYLKSYSSTNTLTFKTIMKNLYNNRKAYTDTITLNLENLFTGKHHFVYRVDTKNGNTTLFVDGVRHANNGFEVGTYAIQNIVNDGIIVGATGFHNSVLLADYLNMAGHYFCSNIVGKQFRFYNKAIDDIDVAFLNLNNLYVEPVTVSLPCGERNQLEQIHRFFKWQLPGHKSNDIVLRIKSSILTDPSINEVIKTQILGEISTSLPATASIKDIVFEQFE